MQQEQRRRLELDECSLLEIFNKVNDARDLAICSMVCKPWRDACYSVASLSFWFEAEDQEEMWQQEHIISRVLSRLKYEAPGCLQKLQVHLRGKERATNCIYFKPSAHWLALADSLTSLTLESDLLTTWGPAVLSYLLTSCTLEKLKTSCRSLYNGLFMQGWTVPYLRTCNLYYGVTTELVEGLLAACPALQNLFVDFLDVQDREVVEVSSGSLRNFQLLGRYDDFGPLDNSQNFKIILRDVPSLRSLSFGNFEFGRLVLSMIRPMERLVDLEIRGSCRLEVNGTLSSLRTLTLMGNWCSPQQLGRVLELSSMIRRLNLVGCSGNAHISSSLSPMLNLRNLHVDYQSLDWLRLNSRLERLTVHCCVHVLAKADLQLQCLRSLVVSCGIRLLVVEYNNRDPEVWKSLLLHDLFELLLEFPGRVLFKPWKRISD